MDIRDVLGDGVEHLFSWLADNTKDLTEEQLNWLPPGKGVSIGFNLWHATRTADNIANFVLQKQPPIWIRDGFVERLSHYEAVVSIHEWSVTHGRLLSSMRSASGSGDLYRPIRCSAVGPHTGRKSHHEHAFSAGDGARNPPVIE